MKKSFVQTPLNLLNNQSQNYMLPEKKKVKEVLFTNTKNIQKDKEILKTLAPYYLNFFSDRNPTPPMFVDTSDFRCTKVITMSIDIVINAGQSTGILFDPFDPFNPVQKWTFVSGAGMMEPLPDFRTKLSSYSAYKVVEASAKLKQISILSLNDGYGTVFDAIIAPSSFDPYTQGERPLNVNIAEKFKKDTIDGRAGIKALILGNPYADWINVSNPQPIINPTVFTSGTYHQNFVPGSIFSLVTEAEALQPTFSYKGETSLLATKSNYYILESAADKGQFYQTHFMSNIKRGMKFWVKITPPTQQTSFKFVYKIALEVIPGTELTEDVQMFSPPFNYQTERIFSTIYNNIDCLSEINEPILEADCKINYMNKIADGCYSQQIGYNPGFIEESIVIDSETFRNKNSIASTFDPKKCSDLKNKEGKLLIRRWYQKNKFGFISEEITPLYYQENKEKLSFASSENVDDIKALFTRKKYKVIKMEEQQKGLTIPNFLKNAIKFVGDNIGKINSSNQFQRLLKNSMISYPEVMYQFFPVFSNNTVEQAVVCVKQGIYENTSKEIMLMDTDGNEYNCKISFNLEDLDNQNDIDGYILPIIAFLNSEYYANFPEEITIRFFSPLKVADRSYGAALIAALMAAPCGQVSTGSVQINEEGNALIFKMMDEELIKNKSINNSQSCPLIAPYGDVNARTYLISGLRINILSEKVYTYKELDEFLIFMYILPSIKSIKQTPYFSYISDFNSYLSNLDVSNSRLYIYLRNFAPLEVLQTKNLKKEEKIKMPPNAYIRCAYNKWNRYVFYGLNNRKYIDVQDFLDQDPDILTKLGVPHFYYKDNIYAYIPAVTGRLPKQKRKLTTSDILDEYRKLEGELKKVTEQEIQEMIGERIKNIDKEKLLKTLNNFGINKNITYSDIQYQNQQPQIQLVTEEQKNLMKNLTSIFEMFERLANSVRTGRTKYLEDQKLAPYLHVPNGVHPDDFKKLTDNTVTFIVNEMIKNLKFDNMAKMLCDISFEKVQTRPRGETNWNEIKSVFAKAMADANKLETKNKRIEIEKKKYEEKLKRIKEGQEVSSDNIEEEEEEESESDEEKKNERSKSKKRNYKKKDEDVISTSKRKKQIDPKKRYEKKESDEDEEV